jgi:hypothetical protein
LVGIATSPTPVKPALQPATHGIDIQAKRLIVNGDFIGTIAEVSVVGDKLYVNTKTGE